MCHLPICGGQSLLVPRRLEEGDEGGYFWEGICDDFEESFAGDAIELVCQVKEDCHAGR